MFIGEGLMASYLQRSDYKRATLLEHTYRKGATHLQRSSGVSILQHLLTNKTPAHHQDLGRLQDKIHQGLHKAKTSLAIQICTENVDSAVLLHARRIPDVISPACKCGWRKEDPEHVIYSVEIESITVADFTKQRGLIGTNR